MSTVQNTSLSLPSISTNDIFLVTVFLSAVIHAFILLGISFTVPVPPKVNKQIEITFASIPALKAPKNSSFLAQENQVGAGKKTKRPTPRKQKLSSQGNRRNKPPRHKKTQRKSIPKANQKLITQRHAEQKISTSKIQQKISEKNHPQLTAEALQQQIAQLGAKIRHSRQSSELTKIKFVNSISTHKYVAAQYVNDWEHKVESVGNNNYPKIARKKGFTGSLITDVGINADGSIYSIRITKSSGNKSLDDAAKRIIRLSAPFAALPKELLKELEVLVITRVWKFSDETGIISR